MVILMKIVDFVEHNNNDDDDGIEAHVIWLLLLWLLLTIIIYILYNYLFSNEMRMHDNGWKQNKTNETKQNEEIIILFKTETGKVIHTIQYLYRQQKKNKSSSS